jgi:membrane fusion protein (multidrug efflux system)
MSATAWPQRVGLGTLLACTLLPALAQPPGQAVPVETAAVQAARASLEVQAVGSLAANEATTVRPEIPGRIAAIHFREGQRVRAGERLVGLEADEYRARLAQSVAEADLARLNFQRAEDLYRQKAGSKQDYDSAIAKLKAAEATRELDQVRLAKTEITAPFAGVLGLRRVSPGDYIEAGDVMVSLVNDDPVKLDLRLPERYANSVRPGHRVRLRVDALPQREFSGEVYAVDPALDSATRTLVVRAKVPNGEGLLRPGMFVRATTVLEQRDQALWIPEEAIVPRGARQFVYRVADGKAGEVEVTLGLRDRGRVEVLTGLAATDTLVTSGQMKLRDGTPVQAVQPPDGVGRTPAP